MFGAVVPAPLAAADGTAIAGWVAPVAVVVALALAGLAWYLALLLAAARRMPAPAAARVPAAPDNSQEQLRAILHTTQDLIYVLDGEGRVQVSSKSVREALLATDHHLVGQPLAALPLPAAFLAEVERRRHEVIDSGRSQSWQELVETPTGARHYACRLTACGDAALRQSVLTIHDGTAARNLEAALRRSEALFRRVFDEAPVGMALVDQQRNFTRVNAAMVRMLGYGAGELDAQPLSKASHPQDLERDVAELAELNRRDRGVLERQKRYVRKDGTQGWADVGAIRLNDDDGGFIANLVIIADITDSQHLRELEQLTKELKRSNEDLQQFAYIASHDLQEPLRAVSSCAALLAKRYRGQLDERADQFIDFTVEGAKRMQELIQDLLAFSRIGSSDRPFAPVDLNEVLVKARLALKAAIDESGAEIHNGHLPVVHGDRTMLTQVLQNLIGNAIKYRSEQPPRIRVDARQLDGAWEVTVADNGIGIAPEFHERIFGIFKRLHSRKKYDGNGVGLAICRKAIERHGGRIRIESREGHGSAFHFTVPSHAAAPRPEDARRDRVPEREPVTEAP